MGAFLLTSCPLIAQQDSLRMDSVEISLLTCQPHDEIYSLYGHTALRYHDLRKGGLDIAFNYGVFDYKKPFFALRFVFGLTDYELGAYPYRLFQEEYRRFGSMVTEQVLNLTDQEKAILQQALAINMQNENRIYRYNYFYSNCTTKARDIIEQCIQGTVSYADREGYTPTHREMIHEMTKNNPWAAFGNDMLLGLRADIKTDLRQQEFLPSDLQRRQFPPIGQGAPDVRSCRCTGGEERFSTITPCLCGHPSAHRHRPVLYPTAPEAHLQMVGRPADDHNRCDGHYPVPDALLPASYRECQSADSAAQSPALVLPVEGHPRPCHPLLEHYCHPGRTLSDRQSVPTLC